MDWVLRFTLGDIVGLALLGVVLACFAVVWALAVWERLTLRF